MNWSELDLRMIKLIKNNYQMLSKKKLNYNDPDVCEAWNLLSASLEDVSGQVCKIRWHNIQNHYFQLKNAIKDGKQYLTDTNSKYLDGTLSFLDSETENPQSAKPNSNSSEQINVHDNKQLSTSFQVVVEKPHTSKEDSTHIKADDQLALREIAMDILKIVDNKHETVIDKEKDANAETSAFIKFKSEDDGDVPDAAEAVIIINSPDTKIEDEQFDIADEPSIKKAKLESANIKIRSSEPKSILDLNSFEPNNKTFYGELSDYVVSRFSLDNQREIRLRICSMLTNSDITFQKNNL